MTEREMQFKDDMHKYHYLRRYFAERHLDLTGYSRIYYQPEILMRASKDLGAVDVMIAIDAAVSGDRQNYFNAFCDEVGLECKNGGWDTYVYSVIPRPAPANDKDQYGTGFKEGCDYIIHHMKEVYEESLKGNGGDLDLDPEFPLYRMIFTVNCMHSMGCKCGVCPNCEETDIMWDGSDLCGPCDWERKLAAK